MRLSSVLLRAISGALGVCVALGASGESAAGEPRLSGWYVSAGVGANRSSSMEQVGHNRDTTCYPDEDCSLLPGGTPGGYRWRYDLDAGTGTAFEVLIGRNTGRARLELSAAQRKNDIDQKFTGITYLDGTLIQDAGNDIQSNATASVGDLTTRTLSLSAYYDFPLSANPNHALSGRRTGSLLRRGVQAAFQHQIHGYAEAFRSSTAIVRLPAGC